MAGNNQAKKISLLMWTFFIVGFIVIFILFLMTPRAHAEEPWGKLLASPQEISLGETSTLTLMTNNTVGISISFYSRIVGGHMSAQGGAMTVKPDQTTTYKVELIGLKGERFPCSVTVFVNN
ncbi:MAG: hypothetical protein U9P50_02855 [Patescibacteria group bacterium]|nr:hypothetical protein [Patescibacteria group bacterium]